MFYDRTVRAGLLGSNRFVDLHDDTHRLLYLVLLLRSDDFGCQSREPRELLRDLVHCTQIRSIEQLNAALEALSAEHVDLVRLYDAPEGGRWPGGPGVYLPRFRSSRSYSKRQFAHSPWCKPDGEQYGQVRQAYGRDEYGLHVDGKLRTNPAQAARLARERDQVNVAVRSDQGKRSTPRVSAPDLSQVSDSTATVPSGQTSPEALKTQALELTADQPESVTALPQTYDRSSAVLTPGVVLKEKNTDGTVSRTAKRATRLDPGWTISDDLITWTIDYAHSLGHTLVRDQVLRLADEFRDYWTGTGKAMLDWPATYRSRIRQVDLSRIARQVGKVATNVFTGSR